MCAEGPRGCHTRARWLHGERRPESDPTSTRSRPTAMRRCVKQPVAPGSARFTPRRETPARAHELPTATPACRHEATRSGTVDRSRRQADRRPTCRRRSSAATDRATPTGSAQARRGGHPCRGTGLRGVRHGWRADHGWPANEPGDDDTHRGRHGGNRSESCRDHAATDCRGGSGCLQERFLQNGKRLWPGKATRDRFCQLPTRMFSRGPSATVGSSAARRKTWLPERRNRDQPRRKPRSTSCPAYWVRARKRTASGVAMSVVPIAMNTSMQ